MVSCPGAPQGSAGSGSGFKCLVELWIELEMMEFSGRVLDSRQRGRGFEPHPRHCVVSLSKNINPSLVLVQPVLT